MTNNPPKTSQPKKSEMNSSRFPGENFNLRIIKFNQEMITQSESNKDRWSNGFRKPNGSFLALKKRILDFLAVGSRCTYHFWRLLSAVDVCPVCVGSGAVTPVSAWKLHSRSLVRYFTSTSHHKMIASLPSQTWHYPCQLAQKYLHSSILSILSIRSNWITLWINQHLEGKRSLGIVTVHPKRGERSRDD